MISSCVDLKYLKYLLSDKIMDGVYLCSLHFHSNRIGSYPFCNFVCMKFRYLPSFVPVQYVCTMVSYILI
jgi:hypothetical protein